MDEANAILLKRDRGVDVPRTASRITQVWFSGVHSHEGGGYPEDQLSLVSLQWMMDQCRPTVWYSIRQQSQW